MRFNQMVLQLTVLALFINLAFSLPVNATISMGVSNYHAKTEIPIGESKKFPVARIYNTGNETFTASLTANLNCSDNEIKFTVEPMEITLQPEENCLVYLIVNCTKHASPGTYQFTVEIRTMPENEVVGNMVLPTATVDGEIVVPEPSPDFTMLFLAGVGGCSGLIATYIIEKRRKGEKKRRG